MPMDIVKIYECLCDPTRLRILNLLRSGPLCVCHIQEILGEPQVKISRHLNYLKTRGLADARREANWMIYSLPAGRPRELDVNLDCMQERAAGDKLLKRDNAKLATTRARLAKSDTTPCCMKS